MLSIKNGRYIWLALSLALSIGSIAMTGVFIFRYKKAYNQLWNQARTSAINQTHDASKELINFIEILKPLANSIADELGKKEFTKQEVEELLRTKKIDDVTGVGVAFLPNAFDKNIKLFGRSFIEQDGKIGMVNIEDLYDYTDQKHVWFNEPLKKGAGFLEPYRNEEMNTMLAEYSVPIYRTDANGKRTVIGVAFANQSLEHLQHIIETLFLGRSGYWFILTEKGSFLAYPQLKYASKTIFNIAQDLDNVDLKDAAEKIIKGESITFEYNNEITGAPSWLVSSPIVDTPWSIIGVFDQGEISYDPNVLRRMLIMASIAFLLSVIFLSLFSAMFYKKRNTLVRMLFVSIISLAIFIQIGWMWYAIYVYPYQPAEPNIYRIESKMQLYEYLKNNFPSTENEYDKKNISIKEQLLKMVPRKEYIPTGIYINSLQFAEASEIKLSAYFWQRFSKGFHDKVPKGFVFSQTNDAKIVEESTILDRNDQDEIITYDVFAKLNQFLTYTLYPFDMKSLRIKYWSKTSDETFYLVPDLNSYQLINPRSLPGIDPDVYMPGWTLVKSYFGYQTVPYTTNFGSYSIGPFGVYRELDISAEAQPFFEVVIRRNLSDALVSDLIPVAVIAVLLFLVLLVSGPNNDKYLTAIASIFFATIFAQIRFRSKIPQAQIVYLESLYFILYVIMLILLISCFFVQHKIKIKYITTGNNIIIKMLYWPFLFGSFAIVSLFYLW